MNTTHRRSAWGVAFAAFALTMVTACGSEIATAPAGIGEGGDNDKQTAPSSPCVGSADYAERACADDDGPNGAIRNPDSGFGPH